MQFMTGLMHYPMSLLGTHLNKAYGAIVEWRMGKKEDSSAIENLLINQPAHFARNIKNSKDILFFGRYAGMYGFLQLASIALNTDFNNLFDFDMVNRTNDAIKNIYADDDSDENLFGVLQSFTGVGTSKMFYAMQMAGLINTDRSRLERVLFGNIDYESDKGKQLQRYQYGTLYGQIMNKYWPTIAAGRGGDVIRHMFYLYPAKWTKEWNEKIFGRKSKKGKKKIKWGLEGSSKNNEAILQALDLLS